MSDDQHPLLERTLSFQDGSATQLSRRQVLKLGVAAVLLVSGCATFRRESDLDGALGDLDQALAELEPDAKRARVVSIAERIETRARELVAEHRDFVDRFDQLLGEHDVPEAQLTEMIDARSGRRITLRNDLLLLQQELHDALSPGEWNEVVEILNRTGRAVGSKPFTGV